ncbi:HET-domain-containing protein [Mytilinidion resinicola]|uniref:HET-domain-containing protein n=1 Tax=Mytilinidion resinicola TaxID=574789 RepID=A0A6A6Z6L5_9PEZI|nr:HET-domain-containing protein [Mytilinidion resinicola]KAF2816349.1 HET-domain-containing protein [Mytilinidion resinicola]
MGDTGYSGSTIDYTAQQFRLLRLLPGDWTDPITCEAETASFTENPTYYTLSYVWGDVKDTISITLNGSQCLVTRNLWYALRRIRAHGIVEESRIWIDAICIDQSNSSEKTHQVGMMAQIYKNCKEVLIWLGEFEERKGRRESAHIATVNKSKCFEFKADKQISDSPYLRRFREAMRFVERNPWFTRVWVIQEYTLPKATSVLFATIRMPFEAFVAARENSGAHESAGCCQAWENDLSLLRLSIYAFDILADLKKRLRERKWSLLDLCDYYSDRSATNGVDRVYAMLGLASDWLGGEPMLPDYSLPVSTVYTQVCADFINAKKRLYYLSYISGRRRDVESDLPSWAIDWEDPIHKENYHHLRVDLVKRYETAWSYDAAILADGNLLRATGRAFDAVSTVCGIMDVTADEDCYMQTLAEWLTTVGLGMGSRGSEMLYPNGTALPAAWWRGVCGDAILDGTDSRRLARHESQALSTLSTTHVWETTFKALKKTGPQDPTILWESSNGKQVRVRDIWSTIVANIQQRRLFKTQMGFIGFGPGDTTVGDPVWVLSGGYTPFVLRAIKQKEGPSCYELVGSCYVHGIMDGEADAPTETVYIR